MPSSHTTPTTSASDAHDMDKPLFPPGFKYPLSLLNERCQKNGWEKPSVEARRIGENKFSFVATLCRVNKKTSLKEFVRFEPHPPYTRPTSIEARHWGATYVLYRFCNGIQLNRVLPTGPREYWNELAVERKNAPDHRKWMYDPDPFAAAKLVHERQEKAAKRREESSETSSDLVRIPPSVSKEYANSPEVKMAANLRDLVEDAIKKSISLHPEVESISPRVIGIDDAQALSTQLENLGFTSDQSRRAVDFLSTSSPFTSRLLSTLSPLEACIQYLILYVPECDLPQRFVPSANSSSPFVTGGHSGLDDIKKRWLQERMVKEGGWPSQVVKSVLESNPALAEDQASLVAALGRRLLGRFEDVEADVTMEYEELDLDELESLGGSTIEPGHLVVPLPISPFILHIFPADKNVLRLCGHPIYISSNSVSAYVRLHLLNKVLLAITNSLMEPHESFLGTCVRVIEEGWIDIEDNGPPDVSELLSHMVLYSESEPEESESTDIPTPKQRTKQHHRRGRDNRTDAQVKLDFQSLCRENKYIKLCGTRETLPAFSAKDNFLRILDKNRVVVVVGETGSGKTTQLPQFILDSLILSNRGAGASILITQPRRLSAISVAARVSEERLSDGSVGYAIRGESKQNAKTKLLFCTTGIVLRRLSSGDQLKEVTHIVVDEVHERSVDGDFLLLELKEILSKNSQIKIVLMSATINQELFVKYFNGAPLIAIPGSMHPVEDLYLEDFIPLIDYRPQRSNSSQKISKEDKLALQQELQEKGLDNSSINSIRILSSLDRVDYQLIASIANHIVKSKAQGGILIFLPGIQEIRQCIQTLTVTLGKYAEIFPLHANLSSDEQRSVFRPTRMWKIVVATNVAETSITIDDVVYIIDSGKMKENRYDPDSGISRLVETWISRAAGRQRRGRAGRTQSGVCYKLYTRRQERTMADFSIPEILRVPIDSILLSVKAARDDEDAKAFLSKAIDPPQVSAIDSAWETLKELGAVDQDDKITALGRHMATLPVDLRLAKMMILGTVFQCLDPILTVAACLSSKPLFLSAVDKRNDVLAARLRFGTAGSDLLTDVRVYDEWARLCSEKKSTKTFFDENFVSVSAIRDISSLRHDLFSNLTETGFIPLSAKADDANLNVNSSNDNLVKSVILGGLWPRVAQVHLPKSAIKFVQVQAGSIQRENAAKDFKLFDLKGGRVFLHPTSILFEEKTWKFPFLAYFNKQATTKVFLRDATQVPTYALLLFGGSVSVNHIAGGLTVGGNLKLKAWPRIGVLVNQLRQLLDAELDLSIEQGTMLARDSLVVKAMLELVSGDGLTSLC